MNFYVIGKRGQMWDEIYLEDGWQIPADLKNIETELMILLPHATVLLEINFYTGNVILVYEVK